MARERERERRERAPEGSHKLNEIFLSLSFSAIYRRRLQHITLLNDTHNFLLLPPLLNLSRLSFTLALPLRYPNKDLESGAYENVCVCVSLEACVFSNMTEESSERTTFPLLPPLLLLLRRERKKVYSYDDNIIIVYSVFRSLAPAHIEGA